MRGNGHASNSKHYHDARSQVGPDPYWGSAGLVGTSSAAPSTLLDNNTVAAPFGGVAVIAFGQGASLPPAQFGKSAHVNMTGAPPAARDNSRRHCEPLCVLCELVWHASQATCVHAVCLCFGGAREMVYRGNEVPVLAKSNRKSQRITQM